MFLKLPMLRPMSLQYYGLRTFDTLVTLPDHITYIVRNRTPTEHTIKTGMVSLPCVRGDNQGSDYGTTYGPYKREEA